MPNQPWNCLEQYYLGDEWIDGMGVSVYGAQTPSTTEWLEFRGLMDGVYGRLTALAPQKPIALLEFGAARGREEWQNGYVQFLLEESNRLNAKFVVWFVPRDYDLFFEKVKSFGVSAEVLDLFKIWKDTGLVDGKGNRRAAFETWKLWLGLARR